MKKIIKNIIVWMFFAPLFIITSCKKDINEINKTNPNEFSDSDAKLMITGAQLANVMLNEGEAARLAGVEKYLFTSSIGVYAPAQVFREDDVWKTLPGEHD